MTSLADKQQSESINMKFSFSWLKDQLETDLSADEVGDVLTDTGLEVESLIDPRKRVGQLSVGEILKVNNIKLQEKQELH